MANRVLLMQGSFDLMETEVTDKVIMVNGRRFVRGDTVILGMMVKRY